MTKLLYSGASTLVLRRFASMVVLPRCVYTLALPLCFAAFDNAMAFGTGYAAAPTEYSQPATMSDAVTNHINMDSVLDRALEQNGAWGFWPSFRMSTTRHDGFDVSGPDGSEKGPHFKQDEQSLLLGVQYNLTGTEKAYTLKIGGFGGIGGTQAYFASVPGIPDISTNIDGTSKTNASNVSGLGGVYALGTFQNFYLLGLASAYDGTTHINQVGNARGQLRDNGFRRRRSCWSANSSSARR